MQREGLRPGLACSMNSCQTAILAGCRRAIVSAAGTSKQLCSSSDVSGSRLGRLGRQLWHWQRHYPLQRYIIHHFSNFTETRQIHMSCKYRATELPGMP
jgi:hypothetical protein